MSATKKLPLVLLDPYRPESAAELGIPCGQLLTPLTMYRRYPDVRWAIDNGAFSRFDRDAFEGLLRREYPHRKSCLWVAVPDVPMSGRRTLEAFRWWQDRLGDWPMALVAQDGMEELDIPWSAITAIFIGGSDGWKISDAAKQIVQTAKVIGLWIHMGRVNTPRRFALAVRWGVDSIDGTGISQYSWMRQALAEAVSDRRPLFDGQRPVDGCEGPAGRDGQRPVLPAEMDG